MRIIEDVMARAQANGGHLTRQELLNWEVDGRRMPVIDYSRGIRNPADFDSTLSIVATVDGPYDDVESPDDGLLHYAYRAGDPDAGDNRKLRNALHTRVPLLLFHKEIRGILTPVAPVYVIGDDPQRGYVTVALDEAFRFLSPDERMSPERRRYALRLARQRLHQPAFRTRVLVAYNSRCAVCELKYPALLDAAHIIPDGHPRGLPTVTNGLAMCKIHHAAYDQQMLAVTPDYRVRIAADLLKQIDGPMLKHGLQEMDGRELWVPEQATNRPDRELLSERYALFNSVR